MDKIAEKVADVETDGVDDMLGISSSWMAMKGLTIRESIEKGFELGFELVELGAAHKYEEKSVETVMELSEKYPDKKFTLHALFPPVKTNTPNGRKNNNENHQYAMNLADKKEHEAILKAVKKMFDISDRLNAEVVGIHGGAAAEVRWIKGDLGFEELEIKRHIPFDTAKTNLKIIAEELVYVAEKRGIKLAIEIQPHKDFAPMMVNPEIFDWLFSTLKSKYFGLLLDIGHLHISSRAEGYDPYEFTRRFKDKIFEMHLHDVKDGKDHFAVGTGKIDFERHLKIIGKKKLKKIPLVFEYHNAVTDEQALKGKKIIENIIRRS